MKKQFTLKSWSRIACRYASKPALLMLIFMLATAARAQHAEVDGQRTLEPGSLSHLLHKHASSDEFTQPNLCMVSWRVGGGEGRVCLTPVLSLSTRP